MPVPVVSVQQMREWEQATWAAGQTEQAVIAHVGEQLAKRAMEITRPGDRIVIVAGKGHNGDDARAMAPHLQGRDVQFITARDPVVAICELQKLSQPQPQLIVDGLFGIGLDRPLSHDWLHLVAQINHTHAPVLSVDVPSGLDADTGGVATAAVQATETMTVGAAKRGLLALDATAYVGRLTVMTDVGLAPISCASEVQWTLPEDFKCFPPRRAVSTHKGSFGHVAIVAGSRGYHGAAVLAARGAQRARPGLITVYTQDNSYLPVASQLQAPMVGVWTNGLRFDRFAGLLFGPGLAASDVPGSVKDAVQRAWLEFEAPVVVDASALEWLPEGTFYPNGIRVITPHPGEAARLLNSTSADVQADRVAAVRELSAKFGGCWVALKGHQTVVGRKDGHAYVNCSGCPALAQGGSGDLLSGYLAGWLAQPLLRTDPLLVLRYAVWEHGFAADRLDGTTESWTVEELAQELGRGRQRLSS